MGNGSAGSGKSFTIAWLAHQLSTLFGPDDRRIFDSILVITDRRILDRQLQRTVRQFEQTLGVVENIDQTSRQLKEAVPPRPDEFSVVPPRPDEFFGSLSSSRRGRQRSQFGAFFSPS